MAKDAVSQNDTAFYGEWFETGLDLRGLVIFKWTDCPRAWAAEDMLGRSPPGVSIGRTWAEEVVHGIAHEVAHAGTR